MLTFSDEYLSDYVHFGVQIRMKVRRFRPSPKQFKNCFEYGNISEDCVNKERCYKCSKAHEQNTVLSAVQNCSVSSVIGITLHSPVRFLGKDLNKRLLKLLI